LTAILGTTELMPDLPDGRSGSRRPPRYPERLGARGRVDAAALTFSRQQVVSPRCCAERPVLELEKLLRRLLGEDVAIRVASRRLRRREGRPGQLEQVIVNLAVNARDAMPNGGTSHDRDKEVDLDANLSTRSGH